MKDQFLGKIPVLAAAGLAAGVTACGQPATVSEPDTPPAADEPAKRVAMKRIGVADPNRGRTLFVEKGCVICHSVNGVGGKAAPALGKGGRIDANDPLEFAAGLWRSAPAMIELQEAELGYSIDLSARDIADLAAFAADKRAQAALTEDDLTEELRASLLDLPYWQMDDWMDLMRARGRLSFPADDGVEFTIDGGEVEVEE